jgi:glycosyltransferase involved in cell wall biosynthesis
VGGDAALYADPDDAATFAATLSRVLDDPGLAADLSARGRRRAAGLGYDATARATHAVYQRVRRR